MSDPGLRLAEAQSVIAPQKKAPLGRILVEAGLLSTYDLIGALEKQRELDTFLGDILIKEGLVDEADVLDALARQHQVARVRLDIDPPAPNMEQEISAELCQAHMIVPWRRIGQTLLVAMAHPENLDDLVLGLAPDPPKIIPVIATRAHIQTQIGRLHGAYLARKATSRLPEDLSARHLGKGARMRGILALSVLMAIFAGAMLAPTMTLTLVLCWAVLTLAATLSLKVMACLAQVLGNAVEPSPWLEKCTSPKLLPNVSIMVPLFKEKEIAGALIKRLERLTYPKSLLDVVLVLEAKDSVTIDTIARTKLPPWITVVTVPDDGTITTKPRALNYALDFCRGQIVGVWDAEDAPETDQIEKVVSRFQSVSSRVACLQGMLDYYNARTNWIARCFTIEYATWWRIVMPGMARLGFVIPLGGTTLFFRREALEELGAWDAHNVTEDADLGVRLARAGYVTDLIPTVTMEEANCRALPWVRQRSRWLKGFLITYLVHMRRPLRLLRDLGFYRFFGIQVIFLATVSQFAALPILWTFWVPWLGFPTTIAEAYGFGILVLLGVFFLTAELLNIVIGMIAVSGPKHRHLMVWVLTMPIYFTLGGLAVYKALFEIIVTPFYWDKTSHGVSGKEAP